MSSFLLSTLQEAQRRRDLNDHMIRGMYSTVIPEDYNINDHDYQRGERRSVEGEGDEGGNNHDATTMFNQQSTFSAVGASSPAWFSRYPVWRHQLVLWEIQERFRRSIAYVVILFLLIRTCTEAMMHDDFGLLLIGIFLTTCLIKVLERRQAETNARRLYVSRAGIMDAGGDSNSSSTSDDLSVLLGDGTPPSSALLQTQLDMQQFGQISARSNIPFQMQLALAMMQSQQQTLHNHMIAAGMMQRQRGQRNLMQLGVPTHIQQKWSRFDVQEDNNDTNFSSTSQARLRLIPKQRLPPMRPCETEDLEIGVPSSDVRHLQGNGRSKDAPSTISIDPNNNSCSICLSTYENGETVVKLPCGHLYHDACAKEWVERSVKCPLCNQALDSTPEDIK